MELEELKKRYHGTRAQNYDRDRVGTVEWAREQEVVETYLKEIRLNTSDIVLDIPVGTGRFFDLYAGHACRVVGLDVSEDMLSQAVARASEINLAADLRKGDVTNVGAEDSTAKVVICVRIFNLLDFKGFQRALAEAARVTEAYVIAGIQVRRRRSTRGRMLRRLASALRSPVSNKPSAGHRTTTPHPETSVLREFRKCGLTVQRQEIVVNSPSSPYYLYLLRRMSS